MKTLWKLSPIVKGAGLLFFGEVLLSLFLIPLLYELVVANHNNYFIFYAVNAVIYLLYGVLYIMAGFIIGRGKNSKLLHGLIATLLYLLLLKMFFIGQILFLFSFEHKEKAVYSVLLSVFSVDMLLELFVVTIFVCIGLLVGKKTVKIHFKKNLSLK